MLLCCRMDTRGVDLKTFKWDGYMCFIGNLHAYQEVKGWLSSKPPESARLTCQSILLLTGPPGVGKTHGVKCICDELGLVLEVIDTHRVANFKEFQDMFFKLCASDITTQFGCIHKDNIIICIEELDALSVLDRTFVSSLNKMVESNMAPNARVIITSQSIDVVRKGGVSVAKQVHLIPPGDGDMMVFLRSQFSNMPIKDIMNVIKVCGGNIGYAINMLSSRSRHQVAHALDKESNLVDVYLNPDVQGARKFFLGDPWVNPLRFHENLASEWRNRKGTVKQKRSIYKALIRDICMWDMMMSLCKKEDAPTEAAIEILAHAICVLRHMERKPNAPAPTDDFTRMLSNLSLTKKNNLSLAESSDRLLQDGIHSYHRALYDSVVAKPRKKKCFLSSQ